jgi:hypothetical protein
VAQAAAKYAAIYDRLHARGLAPQIELLRTRADKPCVSPSAVRKVTNAPRIATAPPVSASSSGRAPGWTVISTPPRPRSLVWPIPWKRPAFAPLLRGIWEK